MADISILSRLIGQVQRNVDVSQNTLVVGSLKVGSVSPTELTKAILDRLISLQNGTDVDATYHTHDGRYYTETEIGQNTGTTGSDLVGDDNSYSNFTPAAATVKGALSGIDSALGSATASTAIDTVFRIKNFTDNTKQIAFDASPISGSTTRTIAMADADVNLADVNNAILKNGSRAFTADQPMGGFKLTGLAAGSAAGHSVRYEQAILVSGANAFAANQSMGSFRLTNVSDPSSAQDAATKAYVDSLLDGRTWKQPVRAASTANVDLAVAADPSPFDGVTLADGDRVLLKNQTAGEENGIYIAVTAIDPTTWIRSSDANTALEVEGAAVFVKEGTANHDYQFAQTADNVTLGTTPLVWVVTSANSFSGHDMISVIGGQISVDLAAVSGLESTNPGNAAGQLRIKLEASNPSLKFSGSNELGIKFDPAGALLSGSSGVAVQVDNSSIEISSNALRIKALGVTLGHLAPNSVDENKIVSTTFSASGAISGGGGSKVAWLPDNSTLEINSNAARIKAAGVQASHLNTNVADQNTITGGAGAALAVQNAPLVKRTLVAGEAFAADTSFAVRFALNGETAGRVYKADKDASTTRKYMAIGIALSVAGVSAGQNIDVWVLGEYTLGGSDTPFAGTDIGKEVFVGASGALLLGAGLAETANEAAYCIGVVQTTSKIWIDSKGLRGIY